MKRIVLLFTAVLGLSFAAPVSCGKLDVVGTDSVRAFDKVLRQTSRAVTADEMNGGWSLAAPDGAVRFIWSKNYAESPLPSPVSRPMPGFWPG